MAQKGTLEITTFYRSQWANYNLSAIKMFMAKTVAQLLKVTKYLSTRTIFCSLDAHGERKMPLCLIFLNPEKAFDSVPHQLIGYVVRGHNVPWLLIK